MKNKLLNLIKKENYTKQKVIIALILSILIAFTLVVIMPVKIWDRLPIFAVILMFVFLHAILPLNKIYDFIYKKRYLLALIIFIYIIIMGYSGSSIGLYEDAIPSKAENENIYYLPILGKARPIRSDEWNVGTMVAISQTAGEEKYEYNSDKLRGTETDVLSIFGAPVLDITLIGKPFNIGYILFGAERGLSFVWYGRLIALMLASFEFFMLITNKKKLISLLGMILVVFSAATQWWYMIDVMLWGMLALVLIDKFMLAEKMKVKILCALGILVSAVSYVFIFYPAWQVPFAYIYLAVFIWIVWKNRKIYKINWKDILIVLLVILVAAGVLIHYLVMSKDTLKAVSSTAYPGERFEMGGGAAYVVFSYVYSFLFPYKHMVNPCELSGMLSLFPIPMIVAIIYFIRNRKKEDTAFLVPMLIVSIVFSIFTLMRTNELFAKLTLLYMVPASRLAVPLGLTQIILMVYVMAHCKKEDKILGKYISIIISVIASIFILSTAIKTDSENVMGELTSYICGLIVLVSTYLLFTINKEKNKEKLIALLIPIALLTGATVNPIQRGISVITEKPVAKKIQEIVKDDPQNNLWVVEGYPNYALANGAKVVNCIHSYPNFEFYKIVLGEEEFKKEENELIYNRYAHIQLQINQNENSIELIGQDNISLKITLEKLKELNIKYILTRRDLKEFETEEIKLNEIYSEVGMIIYRLEY